MNCLLSIVVLTYNAENYINGFLLNLCKLNDTQIIVIDDNSQDKTPKIIRENFPNFIFFRLDSHSGQSTCREMGLKLCKGKYVWFIDSDDYIIVNAVANTINLLKKEKTDIFQLSARVINKNCKEFLKDKIFENGNRSSDIFEYFLKLDDSDKPYLWFRLYNRHFLNRNNIHFLSTHAIGEDLYFNMVCFSKAKSLKISDNIIYEYNFGNSFSITTKYFQTHQLKVELANVLCDAINTIKLPKNKREIRLVYNFSWRYCVNYFSHSFNADVEDKKMKNKIISTFKKNGYKNVRFNLITKNTIRIFLNKIAKKFHISFMQKHNAY